MVFFLQKITNKMYVKLAPCLYFVCFKDRDLLFIQKEKQEQLNGIFVDVIRSLIHS